MKNNTGHKIKCTVIVIMCVLLIITGCCAVAGIYVYNASVHSVNQERRALSCKAESLEKLGFDVDAFENQYKLREIEIKSTFDGHTIPSYYFTVDGSYERDTVVLAHGLNGNRLTGYPVAEMFLRNGYNVLTYDQRASGESDAEYMTCGYWESYDFGDCVRYVRSTAGDKVRIGGWGSSIGGATVGFYLGTKEAQNELSFAVLDCPVSDMEEIIECFLTRKESWIPAEFRTTTGSIVNHIMLGFGYEDGNVCDYVKSTTVPVLVFHTSNDSVTPFHMGSDIYNAMKNNRKKIVSVEDSRHTDIYLDHPEFYEETMMEFIRKDFSK